MIPVTVAVPEDKLTFFKELVSSLNLKEIDLGYTDFEIPEEHKKLVLNRIENSKTENCLRWDDVKDEFKLD